MAGWNTGTEETGMSVQNVHVIHVGHWADGYCYPCNDKQHSCSGGPATAGAGRGYCGGVSPAKGYQGYRAVIGAIYGEPGGLAAVSLDNIRVSGPYWRAVSLATTWSMFGQDPVGSISGWVFGGSQPLVFEQPQKPGIRSKLWATGAGTISDIAFPGLSIANTTVSQANREEFFWLADECTPESSLGKNVRNISFGRPIKSDDVLTVTSESATAGWGKEPVVMSEIGPQNLLPPFYFQRSLMDLAGAAPAGRPSEGVACPMCGEHWKRGWDFVR